MAAPPLPWRPFTLLVTSWTAQDHPAKSSFAANHDPTLTNRVPTRDWSPLDDVLDATVLRVTGFNGSVAYVSGEEEYLVKGHIPGAVFADLFDDFSDPEGEYAFAHPAARHFERAAQAHGVDNDTAVVVYDTGIGTWAARLWWLFRSFGFEVRVLDGGLTKWRAEGRELATGDVRPRRAGDFSAEFDQAGVFLRVDDETWTKAGVEFADGALQLGAVVTHRFSDWSVAPVPDWAGRPVTVRVSRSGDAVTVRARAGDDPFRLVRIAHLEEDATAEAGPMVCAPSRAGLTVRFSSWTLGPADASIH